MEILGCSRVKLKNKLKLIYYPNVYDFLEDIFMVFPSNICIPKVYIPKMNNENKEERAVLGSIHSFRI